MGWQGSLFGRNVFHYVSDFALEIITNACQHKEVDSCNLVFAVILQLSPLNVGVDADLVFAYALCLSEFVKSEANGAHVFLFSE